MPGFQPQPERIRRVQPDNVRYLPVSNMADEDAPPYCLLKVIGQDEEGRFLVKQPDQDSEGNLLVNGGTPIGVFDEENPEQHHGQAIATFPAAAGFVAEVGGRPKPGQTWGAKADSWYLNSGYGGFRVIQGGSGDLAVIDRLDGSGGTLELTITESGTIDPGTAATVLLTASTCNLIVTGISGGWDGRQLKIVNVGDYPVLVQHDAEDVEDPILCPPLHTLQLKQNCTMPFEWFAADGAWRVMDWTWPIIKITDDEEADFSVSLGSSASFGSMNTACCEGEDYRNIYRALAQEMAPPCDLFASLGTIWAKRLGNSSPGVNERYVAAHYAGLIQSPDDDEPRALYLFEKRCCDADEAGSSSLVPCHVGDDCWEDNPVGDPPDDDVPVTSSCCSSTVPSTLYAQLFPNNVVAGADPLDTDIGINRTSLGTVITLHYDATIQGWQGDLLESGFGVDYVLRLTCVGDSLSNWHLAVFSSGGAGSTLAGQSALSSYYGNAQSCSPFDMAFDYSTEPYKGTGAAGVWRVTATAPEQDCACVAGTFTLAGITSCMNMNRTWTLTKQDDGCYWFSELVAMADSGACAPFDHFGKIFWKMHSVILPDGQRYWNLSCEAWAGDTYNGFDSFYGIIDSVVQYNATTAADVNGSVVFTQRVDGSDSVFSLAAAGTMPASITVDLLTCTAPGSCTDPLCVTFDGITNSVNCSTCESNFDGQTFQLDFAYSDASNCYYGGNGPQNACGGTVDYFIAASVPKSGTGTAYITLAMTINSVGTFYISYGKNITSLPADFDLLSVPSVPQSWCDFTGSTATLTTCGCGTSAYEVPLGSTSSTGGTGTTLSSITTETDDVLVVRVVYKSTTVVGGPTSDTCTYNGSSMTKVREAADSSGLLVTQIWTRVITGDTTGNIVHTSGTTVVNKALTAARAVCLATRTVEMSNQASGTSTTHSASTATFAGTDNRLIVVVIGTINAATGDADGTWGAPISEGSQDVTVNGVLRLCEGSHAVTSSDSSPITCQKTGATSRGYAGVLAVLK